MLQDTTQDCKYHKQFEDVACRPRLRLNSSLCEGTVQVRYSWGAPCCSVLYVACIPVHAFTQLPADNRGKQYLLQVTHQQTWCVATRTQPAWCSGR